MDATDRERINDCRQELEGLLQEEVRRTDPCDEWPGIADGLQRLMGASLLVFKNKSDVSGSMSEDEVREVETS